MPLSDAFLAALGDDRAARLRAATAGDDYELLFAAPADAAPTILALAEELGLPLIADRRASRRARAWR